MPKLADHDARRRQIAGAVWRLAAARGLEEVSLRNVAADAGVSVRLVQYYFGTRDELLVKALEMLNEESGRAALLRAPTGEPTPRQALRHLLLELLPLDDERRTRYLVHLAYLVRSLDDPALGRLFRDAPAQLEELAADLLDRARHRGEVPPDVDVRTQGELLVAVADGLATGVVLGQRTAERAVALVDHELDRLFHGPDRDGR